MLNDMCNYYKQELEKFLDLDCLDIGYRYFRVAELLYYLGLYEGSLELTKIGYQILENYYNTSEMAYIINLYARLCDHLGDDSALDLYREALTIRRKVFGRCHVLVANSINNIAVYYQKIERSWDALPLFKECLELTKELFGKIHPEVADVLNNMALAYVLEKNIEEAMKLNEESVDIRKKTQGEKHPKIAASYNNMANICKDLSNLDDAEKYYDEAQKNQFESLWRFSSYNRK